VVTSIRRSLLAARTALPVVGALAFACLAGPALAQCWTVGPAHGQNGPYGYEGVAAGSWDPDGVGPSDPWLAVSVGPGAGPIQVWTGSEWTTIGGWFNAPPVAFASHNGQLHAVGSFSYLSGPLWCAARWSGSAWEMLGSGIGGSPGDYADAVESYGGWLWVGGWFRLGSVMTSCAAWNGFSWIDVGLPGQVADFAVIDGQLYAAVRWGSSAGAVYQFTNPGWTRIGGMADGAVLTVEGYLGEIAAGGLFTEYGGQSASRIARWNGSQWTSLGLGATNAQPGDAVKSLRVHNGQLIAAGKFGQMDGQSMGNVAAWNGFFWSSLGSGITYNNFNSASRLELFNGDLVVVGQFSAVGGVLAPYAARWNGVAWGPFLEGINGRVRAFLNTGTTLYAGGDLDFSWSGASFNHLVGWNGSTFLDNLAGGGGLPGVGGTVNAMTLHSWSRVTGPVLIVGGSFAYAGGDPAPAPGPV